MTESVDAIAVDIGNRAVSADVHVAGKKLNADHRSRLDGGGRAEFRRGISTPRNSLTRIQPEGAELWGEVIERGGGKSGERYRRGDLLESLASRLNASARQGRRQTRFHLRIDAQHLFNWPDTGDGFLGKGKPERDGSGELAVDIDGRSAHPLHDARIGQRSAF